MEACVVVARMNFASMKRAKEREEKRCREFLERKREAKESEKEERGIRSVPSATPLTSIAESIDLSHPVFAPVFFLLHPVQRLSAFQTSKSKLSRKRKRRKTAFKNMASFWTKTASTSSYPSALKDLLEAAPAPRFVLFLGLDPSTKALWCPDVRRCAPAVRKACENAKASLLEVDVGGREAWRGPATPHPFRAAPLSLSGIPTLVAVDEQGKEIGRVGAELEATGSEAEAAEVAGAFVGKFK